MPWIPTIEAMKLLNRSMSAVPSIIRLHKPRWRWVEKGKTKRSVRQFLLSDIKRIAKKLGPRKFSKHAMIPRLEVRTGYMLVYHPTHPRAMCTGCVYEHWLIAEKSLGRFLTKKECVHHINGIRGDNRPENIKVYPDRGAHLREAHGEEYRQRLKLKRLIGHKTPHIEHLSTKEKAKLFDALIKESYSVKE